MIYTNILVNQIRGDKYRKKTAREELWRGQCYRAYWCDTFHGIYDNRLRKAAYRSLIEAEKITHEKGIFIPSIISVDFDMDGRKEYLYQGNEINAYIHQKGGILFELDYLPKCWNYLDTMSRYEEDGIGDLSDVIAKADTYMRKAFIDHFFSESDNIDVFNSGNYDEMGSFIDCYYNIPVFDRENKWVDLACEGTVRHHDKLCETDLQKKYTFNGSTIKVSYKLENMGEDKLKTIFGTEINLAFASKGMESQRIYNCSKQKTAEIGADVTQVKDITDLSIEDITNKVQINFTFTEPAELWVLPIETVNRGEQVIESKYQSTCFLPRWKLSLDHSESFTVGISLSISLNE
jgi:alpha-amylase